MLRKIKPRLALPLAAVVLVSLSVTCFSLQRPDRLQQSAQKESDNNTASLEAKLAAFTQDMSRISGANETSVRNDLLYAIETYEELDEADRLLVLTLTHVEAANSRLANFRCVRSLLDKYVSPQDVDVYSLISKPYLPYLHQLVGEEAVAPERALKARKQIRQLAEKLIALRKQALTLPNTETDDRLYFLEMFHDLASGNYADVKALPEPVLPLFNDREGRFLSLLVKWFNTPYAQRAFPIERFKSLYRDGKFQVLSPVLNSQLSLIKEQLRDEEALAKESQKARWEPLSQAYAAFAAFLDTW